MPYALSPDATTTTIGDCIERGLALHFVCAGGHSARWNASRLAEVDPELTLAQLARTHHCPACGGRDGEIAVRPDRVVYL